MHDEFVKELSEATAKEEEAHAARVAEIEAEVDTRRSKRPGSAPASRPSFGILAAGLAIAVR